MNHIIEIETAGVPLNQASKALIMVHGRGGSALDILSLAKYFNVSNYALLAPQATNHTWYPYSFMAPVAENEPWLGSALEVIEKTVQRVLAAGISADNLYFFGFSQGACLSLEYIARNAQRYGGVVAIVGGVIGEMIDRQVYQGNFQKTPIFIGSSDPDAHVPVERVYDTSNILKEMNADVAEQIYENIGHTIIQEEIDWANKFVFK